jgi:ribosomal peptide maturation radical SAM protein 1
LTVALINMPVSATGYPNLGLSLLKSGLEAAGISADIFYFNLVYAEYCDPHLYSELANGAPRPSDLASEWLFSKTAWDTADDLDKLYIDNVLRGHHPDHATEGVRPNEAFIKELIQLRDLSEPFISRCLDWCDWGKYQVIGFSSVFQQQLASISLAKAIKRKWPEVKIVFGGANVDGPAAEIVADRFGPVDAVFRGEADSSFPAFVLQLLNGTPLRETPSICISKATRTSISESLGGSASPIIFHHEQFQKLLTPTIDHLPIPDFTDYFSYRVGREKKIQAPNLVFEGSRGCWWGAKAHCTFCGLNSTSMAFRQKSAARALAEIELLTSRWGKITKSFVTSDNILPIDYLKTFLPMLADKQLGIALFYEIKSNLSRKDIAVLKAANVTTIQPGIESLNTPLLTLMRKGVTAIQNIQLLKWCNEYQIKPLWNLLVGFPQAHESSYREMEQLIPALTHLPPPNGVGDVRFDRFSPYTDNPLAHGISKLVPYHSYSLVYPFLKPDEIAQLAYYFVGEFEGKDRIPLVTSGVRKEINFWKTDYGKASLQLLAVGTVGHIFDTRHDKSNLYTINTIDFAVLRKSNDISSIVAVIQEVTAEILCTEAEVRNSIARMATGPERLLLLEGNRVLSLAMWSDASNVLLLGDGGRLMYEDCEDV